jgi:hypothetical protein
MPWSYTMHTHAKLVENGHQCKPYILTCTHISSQLVNFGCQRMYLKSFRYELVDRVCILVCLIK